MYSIGALYLWFAETNWVTAAIQPSIWLPNLKFIQKYPAADDYREPSYIKTLGKKKKNFNLTPNVEM
jgi:hypothetical protein